MLYHVCLMYWCLCYRTLEERAQRLFSTKGKSLESLDPSLFAKNPKAKGPKKYVTRELEIMAPLTIYSYKFYLFTFNIIIFFYPFTSSGTQSAIRRLVSWKPRYTIMWRFLG